MAYDEKNLYACFTVNAAGPLKNTGNDWRRLFKSGAAVDLQIGLDPKADAKRKAPAVGDCRLLMTMTGEGQTAVLYQPNAPGAPPEEGWETHTLVAQAGFDRVKKLPEVRMAARGDEKGYCLEAVIPLAALGLKIVPDVPYKFDWGILASGPEGNAVLERVYWANPQTAMLADEAIEAELHPELWGTLRFSAGSGSRGKPEVDLEASLGGPPAGDFEFDLDEE